MIKFTFLSENKTESSLCGAEHGLSIFIEAHGKRILFDLGASDLFCKNAKNLGINLKDTDYAFISHGHYDHTSGIPDFCKINKEAPIYIHEKAFRMTYGMEDGKLEEEGSGIPFPKEDYDHRWKLTSGITPITEDTIVSGTIPVSPGTSVTETFYMKKEDGTIEADDMSHEQFLAIRDEKGVFLFSGCSHQGVIPAVKYAEEIFPETPIYMLVAGMHLYHASEEDRRELSTALGQLGVSKVMPVHCTGLAAIVALKGILGEDCILATAGATYEY